MYSNIYLSISQSVSQSVRFLDSGSTQTEPVNNKGEHAPSVQKDLGFELRTFLL